MDGVSSVPQEARANHIYVNNLLLKVGIRKVNDVSRLNKGSVKDEDIRHAVRMADMNL